MKRWFVIVLTLTSAALMSACSYKPSYALVGVPGQYSYIDSANILIDNGQCSYVIYRGDGTTPPEVVEPCALMADKKDALGNPHGKIEIGFNTAKGPQILTMTEAGTNGEFAQSVPDIGVYLPNNWNLQTPASNQLLKANAQGSVYANLLVAFGGVRCSLTVVPVATNTPVNMPCGLMSWSSDSVSVSIPGALVSTAYTQRSWPLHFTIDPSGNGWNLVKPPPGFPATYTLTDNNAK
ncbi:MAG: hypothetical protein KGL13_08470 [Gammaproteobacteria bacterium]|nr:hypothetical protein [Gammaproteobacteria bacterium]MDE2346488.1 hypothetical protein [Gammaproteobacteria bacterium]